MTQRLFRIWFEEREENGATVQARTYIYGESVSHVTRKFDEWAAQYTSEGREGPISIRRLTDKEVVEVPETGPLPPW